MFTNVTNFPGFGNVDFGQLGLAYADDLRETTRVRCTHDEMEWLDNLPLDIYKRLAGHAGYHLGIREQTARCVVDIANIRDTINKGDDRPLGMMRILTGMTANLTLDMFDIVLPPPSVRDIAKELFEHADGMYDHAHPSIFYPVLMHPEYNHGQDGRHVVRALEHCYRRHMREQLDLYFDRNRDELHMEPENDYNYPESMEVVFSTYRDMDEMVVDIMIDGPFAYHNDSDGASITNFMDSLKDKAGG